jgi:hypothetical protein
MSFADPSLPRGKSPQSTPASSAGRPEAAEIRHKPPVRVEPSTIDRPRGSSYRRTVDWQHVGLVGAGIVIGALIGASAALLLAPASGEEVRSAIRRQARVARFRAGDAWDDLTDQLTNVARRGRRRARRAIRRARWRASDAIV